MPSIVAPDAMKSFAVPELCRDVGKMPRLSPAAARSNPAATPQIGPAVISILFFMQHPSTVITWSVSANTRRAYLQWFHYSREIIRKLSVLFPIKFSRLRPLCSAGAAAQVRAVKHADSQENGMTEVSRLNLLPATPCQVRLPPLRIATTHDLTHVRGEHENTLSHTGRPSSKQTRTGTSTALECLVIASCACVMSPHSRPASGRQPA